jgi:hypothetical protein
MDKALFISKFEAAKHDVGEAEAEIEKLIRELRVMARAEKTTVSKSLEGAFNKLRAARLNLEALEVFLANMRE